MEKIKVIKLLASNLSSVYFFREFFIFYLEKISHLNKIKRNRNYLFKYYGYIGGYCPREFIFFAPSLLTPYIEKIGQDIFEDTNSRQLYKTVFLRNIYSSHFLEGWEEYFEKDNLFNKKLKESKSSIKRDVEFIGNYFVLKSKQKKMYEIEFKDHKKYKLPINWFEVSIFSNKVGLCLLERKYRDYIKNSTLVDIGAFIGDSSIIMAEYTNHNVIAIEPNPSNFNLLTKTIKINHLEDRIDTYNIALSYKTMKLSISDSGAGSRVSKKGKRVNSLTLDKLIGNNYQKIWTNQIRCGRI